MDTLPLETVQQIFELACTDGGATGNALALVSKGFHTIARKARFRSVSIIASPHRVQTFIELYERECGYAREDKPRIRHLLMAFPRTACSVAAIFHRPSPAPLQSTAPTVDASASKSPGRTLQFWSAEKKLVWGRSSSSAAGCSTSRGPNNLPVSVTGSRLADGSASESANSGKASTSDYLSAAQALLRLATPHLWTLVIQCESPYCHTLGFPIISGPFPLLREATFSGVDARALFCKNLSDGPPTTPIFPALTHLSLPRPVLRGRSPPLAFWSAAAPHVTHLRAAGAEDWLEDLASAVGVGVLWEAYEEFPPLSVDPSTPSPTPPPVQSTYPSVRHLLLWPSAGPIGASCGNVWISYAARVRMLDQVERGCQGTGIEALVLPAAKDLTEFLDRYALARKEWLERIEDDGDDSGCWGQLISIRGRDIRQACSPRRSVMPML